MMFLNRQPPLNKTPVIDDSRIEEHNQNFPWHQGPNKIFEAASLADAKKLMGVSFASHSNLPKCNVDDTVTPPESFDYRQQWPNCVHPVANQQKTCAASYAFALTQTLSERLCITSKDQRLRHLSAQELVSCDVQNSGCKGGNLNVALDYMKAKGVVEESCFPYEAEEVKCDKMCSNPTRERVDSYCILFGEDDIKREVYKNGPVVAVTLVHVDFLTYKSGVYHKGDEVPKFSGYHAVKIVGWGVESGSENEPNKGNKYWIVQNSFGEEWGEGGYAKISVGQELMFDQYAYSMRVRGETLQKVAEATTTSTEQKDASLDLDDEVLDDKKDTATKA